MLKKKYARATTNQTLPSILLSSLYQWTQDQENRENFCKHNDFCLRMYSFIVHLFTLMCDIMDLSCMVSPSLDLGQKAAADGLSLLSNINNSDTVHQQCFHISLIKALPTPFKTTSWLYFRNKVFKSRTKHYYRLQICLKAYCHLLDKTNELRGLEMLIKEDLIIYLVNVIIYLI